MKVTPSNEEPGNIDQTQNDADRVPNFSWFERFFTRNFSRLHPITRNIVYILFVLIFGQLYLGDAFIEGQLIFRKEKNKRAILAGDYYVVAPGYQFITNSKGRFYLKTSVWSPFPITVHFSKKGGHQKDPDETNWLGAIDVPGQIPVLSWFRNKQKIFTVEYRAYEEEGHRLYVATRWPMLLTPSISAFAQTQDQNMFHSQRERHEKISSESLNFHILGLKVRDNFQTDPDGIADAYLKLEVDGERIEPAGFPRRDFRRSLLRIPKSSRLGFEDFSFLLPWGSRNDRPKSVRIEVWARHWLGFDERLAAFPIAMTDARRGSIVRVESEAIGKRPPSNAVLTVAYGPLQAMRKATVVKRSIDILENGPIVDIVSGLRASSPSHGVSMSENHCKINLALKDGEGTKARVKPIRIAPGVYQDVFYRGKDYRFSVTEIIATTNPDICRIRVESFDTESQG